jgi:hypothetical protein
MIKLISRLAMVVAAVAMMGFGWPHIRLPHVKVPHVNTPHVKVPHVKLPKVHL